MGSDQILQKITHSLAEVLGIEEAEITSNSKLVGDLQASSLDVVDLLFQLKRGFGIELTLAEIQREIRGQAGGPAAASDAEGGQGFDDALFQDVTVGDVAEWVKTRLPAP